MTCPRCIRRPEERRGGMRTAEEDGTEHFSARVNIVSTSAKTCCIVPRMVVMGRTARAVDTCFRNPKESAAYACLRSCFKNTPIGLAHTFPLMTLGSVVLHVNTALSCIMLIYTILISIWTTLHPWEDSINTTFKN